MSTFQRSSLGEGAGSCPSEAQNAGPSSACLQELERPQNDLANVTAEPNGVVRLM